MIDNRTQKTDLRQCYIIAAAKIEMINKIFISPFFRSILDLTGNNLFQAFRFLRLFRFLCVVGNVLCPAAAIIVLARVSALRR